MLNALHLVRSRKATLKHAVRGVCIVCLLALILIGIPQLKGQLVSVVDIDKGTNRFRVLVWTSVCEIISDYPLTGVGSGNF